MKKYVVELTSEERSHLESIVHAERMAAHKRRHAQVLLAADAGREGPGVGDVEIAATLGCTTRTVERTRQRCVEQGLEAALEHGNRGRYRVKALDGKAEAHVIALACGEPPAGHARWTFRLLADQAVALDIVESCSKSSVHRTLKKTNSSLT